MNNFRVRPILFTHPLIAPDTPTPNEKPAIGAGHVSSIDAVRAFAIAPVLAVHAGVPGFKSGGLGVDLFFAVSGFLITTLLMAEWSKRGAISLKNFWARRFLRLMPAYYLYALGITIAIWLWPGSVRTNHGGWTPLQFTAALWCYLMNYVPMGGIWNGQDLTVHLWSLAVEEQYYLVWPIFLCLLVKFPKYLVSVSWITVAFVFFYFAFFASDQARSVILYGRGISLFLASAVAVTLHCSSTSGIWPRFFRGSANPWLTAALLSSLFAFVLGETTWVTQDQLRHFVLPVLLVFYVAAIARLWYGSVKGIWRAILLNPTLIYIGKVSYGIYLYHEAVRIFVWWASGSSLDGLPRVFAYSIRLALYVALTVAVAGISFRYFEQLFLMLRKRFR